MYVPKVNAVAEGSAVVDLLRHVGVGHLVSAVDGSLDGSVMPLLVDDELASLRGHLARANPQWRPLDRHPAMMIVTATDAYVSPSWYPSKADDPRVVPTWNYEVVHVHGTVTVHDDAGWVEQLVRELTERREETRVERSGGGEVWGVDDAPREFIERMLKSIVGIELVVDRVEAKQKLSQNRSDADRAGVADGLLGSTHHGDIAAGRSMGGGDRR